MGTGCPADHENSCRRMGVFKVTYEMLSDDEQMFMVVTLVARCLKERTGRDYLLPQPLTLEQAADQRRAVWHG